MPKDVLPNWCISLLLALTENIQFLQRVKFKKRAAGGAQNMFHN